MKVKQAILILQAYKKNLVNSCSNQLDGDIEAFDIAIDALEKKCCNDGVKIVMPPMTWEEDEKGYFYCPQCKKYPDYQIRRMEFCPNCGCDLRGDRY